MEQKCEDYELDDYKTFFKAHFDTEFKSLNTEMKNNLNPEENEPIVTNSNDVNNISSKPSMNEEAATPIFS